MPTPGRDLAFDLDECLRSGVFICGTTGSGKTNFAMIIAKHLMEEEIVLFVIDPTRQWMEIFGLIARTTTIGEHSTELPSMDWNTHHILDTSQLTPLQQRAFVELFSDHLIKVTSETKQDKKPNRIIIFEECHTPMYPGSFKSKDVQRTSQLLTQGRNFGIRFIAITQFPASCDKIFVRIAQQRYFFLTSEKSDIDYIRAFIGAEARHLPKLQRGACIYCYRGETERIHSPVFGQEPVQHTMPVDSIDYPLLRKAMTKSPTVYVKNQRAGDEYAFQVFPFGESGTRVDTGLREEVVSGLVQLIKDKDVDFDYIVCFGPGGDKWAYIVAHELKKDTLRITERELGVRKEVGMEINTKLYPSRKLFFRDFRRGDKVIVVDDVVSTGETLIPIIREMTNLGVTIKGVFTIISKGVGSERIKDAEGVPVWSLRDYRPT